MQPPPGPQSFRPCLDCLDLPPDLPRGASPSRRDPGSQDRGNLRVWGESSSSPTHHPYAQPTLLEGLVSTPAIFVVLTLAVVGSAMLLQGCGADVRPSAPSSEASFSPGAGDSRRAGASVRFEDAGPIVPPTRRPTPTPVTVPFVGGPSKAKQLCPDGKELRVAHPQGGGEWKAETLHLLLARLRRPPRSRTSHNGGGGSSFVPGEAHPRGGELPPTLPRRKTSLCST